MKTPLTLGLYAGGLVVAFAAALAIGAAVDPVATESTSHRDDNDSRASGGGRSVARGPASPAVLPGLAVSDAGYTLVPRTTTLRSGRDIPFEFTITAPDGKPVSSYTRIHEKELHLIVVRRDLLGFQHVHPTRAADGTWEVALNLAEAGVYRALADFRPTALRRELTLGSDVFVAGDFQPAPPRQPSQVARVDGYVVTLDGEPSAGREAKLTFTVTRDGRRVTDLQPYLGAFGHLVSLRTGDLAYLHTHPAEEASGDDRGGPAVDFATTFPTAGTYRLFLDFQAGGVVRTPEFAVEVGAARGSAGGSPTPTESADGSGHAGH